MEKSYSGICLNFFKCLPLIQNTECTFKNVRTQLTWVDQKGNLYIQQSAHLSLSLSASQKTILRIVVANVSIEVSFLDLV